ncbi:hypothetical protein FDW98_20525 [Citrobacter sp. wls711]|nr:hypothetical protein FDW98_20525 [Citrobacter sp. wls711]
MNEPLLSIMQQACQYSKHYINTMINIQNILICSMNGIGCFLRHVSPISNTYSTQKQTSYKSNN